MIDPEDDGPAPFASPPCFLHELDAGYLGYRVPVEHQQSVDVARWRRAERARLIAERLALPPEVRRRHEADIATHLSRWIGDVEGLTVSGYWPVKGEPDVRGLMGRILSLGVRMALPVIVARNQPLVFRTWQPDGDLADGVGGIPVPPTGAEVTPDIVIAPVVGFDPACCRLGYGGGYLDRTLALMARRPRVCGVGFAMAAIPTVFPQPGEIPLDAIVTEAGVRTAAAGPG